MLSSVFGYADYYFGERGHDISFVGSSRAISIEELNVSSCPNLPRLHGLKGLKKLRKLDITGCSSIVELDDLRELLELEELRAMHCERLAVLPSCRLPKLRVLEIEPSKVPVQTSIDSLGFEASR